MWYQGSLVEQGFVGFIRVVHGEAGLQRVLMRCKDVYIVMVHRDLSIQNWTCICKA